MVFGEQVRDREDVSNPRFSGAVHIPAKVDRGLLQVGNLPRHVAEVVQNGTNSSGFLNGSRTTKNKVVSKKQGVDGRSAGP